MAEPDLSLLFRLRGDSSGAVKATAETRAAVNQLRQSFGPQLTQSITVANNAVGSITSSLRGFGSQVPVVGPVVAGLTRNVDALGLSSVNTGSGVQGLTRSLGGLAGIAALAATGAIIATSRALADVLEKSSQLGGEIFDLTQKTGLSAERITALKFAADQSGGSIEKFSTGIKNLSLEIANANKGSEEAAEKLKRLGIDPKKAIFDLDAALSKALQTIAKAPPGIAQMTLAADAFGKRIGPELIPTIVSFDGNLDALTERAKGLGLTLTDLEAKELDDFGDALDTIKTQATLLAARFSAQVAPEIVDALRRISEGAGKNRSAIEEWGQGFAEVMRGARVIAQSEAARIVGELSNIVIQFQPLFLLLKGVRALGAQSRGEDPAEDFFGPGGAARGGRRSLPGTPEHRAAQARAAQREDLEKFLKSLEESDTGSALNKAKEALANQLDALRDSIGDRQQAFQAETEDLRRELSKREIDFNEYIKTAQAKNKERLAATLADLQTERNAVKQAQDQGTIDASEAAKKNRQIDNQERDARRAATKEQQRLDDEVAAHERKQLEATTEVLRATIDAQLRIAEIGDQQREASIRALAAMRVKSEEDAEREILKIKLDAIDREKARLETEVKATGSIQDPEEQLKVRARLNLELRVLAAERTTIEQDGERDVEAARQRDLANERRFADELQAIAERIRDIERDTAREVIRLMVLNFASRKDIIRAQLKEDLKEEDERHRRETEIINQEKQETEERIKTLEGYLKNLKVGTAAEIEQYNRLVEALEKLRIKRDELDAQKEAEDRRHKTRTEAETEDAQRKIDLAGPGGGILEGLTTGQLADMQKGIDTFSNTARVALSAVGVAFNQLGQAAGEAVKAFVLFGTAGGSFRKFAAEVLASLAQMAIVKAIFEAAEGLAMLALTYFTGNPKYAASAGFHFASAAAYGAIGGVAALAGRSVAGDIFKPKGATGGGGADSSQGGPQQINPLTLGRNQPQAPNQLQPQLQPQIIEHRYTLSIRVDDSEFGKAVSAHIGKEWRNGGKIRELVLNDADI